MGQHNKIAGLACRAALVQTMSGRKTDHFVFDKVGSDAERGSEI